nr:pentatricopeptide repeat-containing protein At3g56030, mitochondrial-like [Ipomoea batatas]
MLSLRSLLCKTPKSSPFLCAFSTQTSTDASATAETLTTSKYDELINKAGRNGDFDTVQSLLEQRGKHGLFCTNYTFKFISRDISKLDDLLAALSRIDQRFARKSAHDCLVARLSKLRHLPQALRVAEIVVREGYGSNAVTFHPILNELTKMRKFKEAWRVVEAMKDLKVRPDLTAYNYILTGYCYVRDLSSAAGVLTNLENEKLGADTRTYDALVLGACRAGKPDAALRLLIRMEDEAISPLYSTHAHIIGSMVRLGFHAQALEFVMTCSGRDLKLDYENFGTLATKLIYRKRFEDAKVVVKEMKQRGIEMGEKLKEFYDMHATDEHDAAAGKTE